MRRFRAAWASAVELSELNAYAVVLAERGDGSGRRLEIQRALSFNAQDVELGQDAYCLSVDDGASHYGGILGWRLKDNTLTLRLDLEASEVLGTSGFAIEIDAGKGEEIGAGLCAVLGAPIG